MSSSFPPSSRGRGHRTTPEHKARRFGAPHPSTAAAPFPKACALRMFLPPTFDQDGTSTCFAHAQASLATVCLAAAGTPLLWIPSPLGIARNTYCEEQPLAQRVLLQDVGADMADVMTACAREGIRAMGPLAALPGGGTRYSDVTPENIALRPTLADDELGAETIVLGAEQLQPSAPDFLAQVATSIANLRCGVSIGLHATPALERWFDQPPAGFAAFADLGGFTGTDGHDVALTDYRTEADGSLSFWCRSSWGEGGDEGGIWIGGAWLVGGGCLEAWRMQLRTSASGQGAT